MVLRGRVHPGEYHDSVRLMRVAASVRALDGVEEVGVLMGSPANRELFVEAGLGFDGIDGATPDDVVVAVRGSSESAVEAALDAAEELLRTPQGSRRGIVYPTVESALRDAPGGAVGLITVPGEHAAAEARKLLEAGHPVMVFSDNVDVADEVVLKQLAHERGTVLLGSDCGTVMLGGLGLGFANQVPTGPVGVVAASGTGAQVVATTVAALGSGVSHMVGLGGRDLDDEVAGISLFDGLAALEKDPTTEVVVVVGKQIGRRTLGRLLEVVGSMRTPVVTCLFGQGNAWVSRLVGAWPASSLAEAGQVAVRLATGDLPGHSGDPVDLVAVGERRRELGPGRVLRGVFAGGTLAQEALQVARAVLDEVSSNLDGAVGTAGHSIVDLGSDEFTKGRPHPMLDPEAQAERIRGFGADATVGAILLDLVLGHGAHEDPGPLLAASVAAARERAAAEGRELLVVASVCGTDLDPQDAGRQREALRSAGVVVMESARAALFAALCVADETEQAAADARAATWLRRPEAVVSVGSTWFSDAVEAQGADVLHVDWRPPAGGDPELMDILDRLD
ncbi:MAG: acyl-CoA synthetase FdrA [Acidimicrobiia bacterium]|nr:acyl-CoA synthetase FdrA [Acidimicrobiia bacterium]